MRIALRRIYKKNLFNNLENTGTGIICKWLTSLVVAQQQLCMREQLPCNLSAHHQRNGATSERNLWQNSKYNTGVPTLSPSTFNILWNTLFYSHLYILVVTQVKKQLATTYTYPNSHSLSWSTRKATMPLCFLWQYRYSEITKDRTCVPDLGAISKWQKYLLVYISLKSSMIRDIHLKLKIRNTEILTKIKVSRCLLIMRWAITTM